MEQDVRAALLAWLRADPALSRSLNAIEEESPVRASPPLLGIAASASTDWSTKDKPGREIRIALELQSRGDDPSSDAALVAAIEHRIASFPGAPQPFDCVTAHFLRARSERRPRNLRATLIEYRFRVLESDRAPAPASSQDTE